jgi:hypothetical protein
MATILADITNSIATSGLPAVLDVTYRADISVPAGSPATDLIALFLPAATTNESLMLPFANPTGLSYAMNISSFSCASQSESYDVRVFNRDNIDSIGTINEVIVYTEVPISLIDDSFLEYIIKNCDDPQIPYIYVFLNNTGGTDITSIEINLSYFCAQDKLPTNII